MNMVAENIFCWDEWGFCMNRDFKSDKSDKITRISVSRFRGDVSHRIGNIRLVTLEGKVMNTPLSGDATTPLQAEEPDRKISHDAQIRADIKMYKFKSVD